MPGNSLFERLAAPGLADLTPYVPGKPLETLEREYGIRDSIKLASNENPLGPPATALRAINNALTGLGLYPDGEGFRLRNRLARKLGVEAAQITLGNGSNEVLVLAAETFLGPGLEAVFDQHAFVVYSLAVKATAATPRIAASRPGDDPHQPLGHDPRALLACVGPRTRMLFIANPNNPTGSWLTTAELRGLLDQLPRDLLVVLDEAYCEYVTAPDYPDAIELLAEYPTLIVTRTFSKIYALAGLRIGYSVSHPGLAELLNRVRQPFNTNSLAQVAALAALDDDEHVRRSRELNASGREALTGALRELGFGVLPSQGNFVLIRIGEAAADCHEALLRAGIIVRPVAAYGLPEYLRITVGLPAQNERLLEALRAWRRAR